MTNGYCHDCHPANADKAVITEYFKDKYADPDSQRRGEQARAGVQTVVFMIMIMTAMLLFTTITTAQIELSSVSLINHSCEWVNEGWVETIPVYTPEKCVYEAKNDSEVCSTEFIRNDYVPHDDYVLYCKQDLLINEKQVSYELQGYECSETDGVIICDSCTDGNCDGVCSPNGGETCCRFKDGVKACKNSVVGWDGTTNVLPVERLVT